MIFLYSLELTVLITSIFTNVHVFFFLFCRVALGLFITVLITMVIVYYKHKWSKRRTRVRRIAGKSRVNKELLHLLGFPMGNDVKLFSVNNKLKDLETYVCDR